MSAEHGGFIRAPGETKWTNFTEVLDMSWLGEVEEIFKYYTEVSATRPTRAAPAVDLFLLQRTTGSHIEVKKSSVTWHYRASDPEWGLFQCRQCQDLLENNLSRKRPIEGEPASVITHSLHSCSRAPILPAIAFSRSSSVKPFIFFLF